MSEPFAFLDEEEEDDDRGGIAWLPVTLGVLAIAGFLSIPILGLFNTKQEDDWAKYGEEDPIEVAFGAESVPVNPNLEPLLTPDPDDLRADLVSVDETLSSLGSIDDTDKDKPGKTGNGLSVERKASSLVMPGKESKKSASTRKPKVVALKNTSPKPTETAKRIPRVQTPRTTEVAARAARPSHQVEVRPGDTLYSISKGTQSTPDEIARINGISPNDPIKVGQKIRVPGYQNEVARRPQIASNNPAIVKPNPRPVSRPTAVPPQRTGPKIVKPAGSPYPTIAQPKPVTPTSAKPSPVDPGLFPTSPSIPLPSHPEDSALPKDTNPLDKYNTAIAYRVQSFDNINKIADAHATTPQQLIELNGRTKVKKGEMLVVPVDNCLLKNK